LDRLRCASGARQAEEGLAMRICRLLSPLALAAVLAPSGAAALTAAESSCRDAGAASITRYATAAAKVVVRCHQRRAAGTRSLDTDCNDVAEADLEGRLAARRHRVRKDILATCAATPALLANFSGCPSPAAGADDGGASPGIDDYGEVADCLIALADARVGKFAREAEGAPSSRLLDPLRKCQTGLGKGGARVLSAMMTGRRRCQNTADCGGGSGDYACDDADPRGRIRIAAERFESKTAPLCAFSSDVLAQLHACASESAALVDCAAASARNEGAELIRSAYSLSGPVTTTTMEPETTTTTTTTTTTQPPVTTTLPGNACGETFPECNGSCPNGSACVTSDLGCGCSAIGNGPCAPATIRRSIVSQFSTTTSSKTALSAGWSGLAGSIDMPEGNGDVVDVTCDENCENCAVSLNVQAGEPTSNCRCTANQQTSCTVINGSDPASCGSLDPTCRCYFGSPLPISSGGNPACVVIRTRSDYGGTMNLRTGDWADQLNMAAAVYLGLDTKKPCPTCEGDPVPNDGVRGGTCSGGLSSSSCDASGVHPNFGATSLDCLPTAAANISGTGLLIKFNLSTASVSLPSALPCDTPSGALCPCRTCSGNSNQGCSSNAECAATGSGTCTAAGGAGVIQNQCDNFDCDASGECSTGPVDMYCDGAVYPDGRGYVPCTSDADCSSGNAGTCSIPQVRRCLPDPITNTGSPDAYAPTSVSAFCVAPTSNPTINIAAGLPGPGTLLLTFRNDLRCQNDPELPWQPPSGENCGGIETTTTTLLPLPGCADAVSPLCGGFCPTGQTCGDSGGTCTCTGLPLPSCDDATAPLCGGICATTGEVCTAVDEVCECRPPTLPQCLEASAPACGGLCPLGELCSNVGGSCECGAAGLPSCSTALSPTCAGLCDVGQVCIDSGGTCGCLDLGLPTCAESTAPLCAGTCSLGSLCSDVGGGCQCTPLPLP